MSSPLNPLETRMLSDSQYWSKNTIPADELFWPYWLSSWPVSLVLCFLSIPGLLIFMLCTLAYYPCWISQTFPACLDWHPSLIIIISRHWVLVHWLGGGDLSQKFTPLLRPCHLLCCCQISWLLPFCLECQSVTEVQTALTILCLSRYPHWHQLPLQS